MFNVSNLFQGTSVDPNLSENEDHHLNVEGMPLIQQKPPRIPSRSARRQRDGLVSLRGNTHRVTFASGNRFRSFKQLAGRGCE